ncbi:GNAT family N-acetyltransferase [Francisella philomiragia]|uniref:GNAT family N-acetyltransferase n=1 Tax=Francisella philomiragia TaxID=28110 RepID=UPI001907E856|nr:GNAT family N-acetyltransferase [Francisella philomiragia]MBK2093025.1 GNAT family N-acetyltransferase [Francisella philomiragia]MBK2256847.1 GNAT family N-acetyltransferase [Francisella philomiragia]MBK2269505.1 GNAT family N-acetyltransferase [Francisella philomiragia]MBK2271130.1 GNAT family N-acetyltransferase [Francisella philomiragia]MBK2274910.1 GNAT family N-acetyltransferase [Francisella philomiragia]
MKKEINYYKIASTRLLEKIISEFSYEGIFKPLQKDIDQEVYTLEINSNLYYKFKAVQRIYGNLTIEKDSVTRHESNSTKPADDAIRLIIDTLPITNIDSVTTAHLIKELNNTIFADIAILQKDNISAKDIYKLPYAYIEGNMTGHPWFVINKGRIGFNASDYANYAPEMQKIINLVWIAVNKDLVTFSSIASTDYLQITNKEINSETLLSFNKTIKMNGKKPSDFYILPVHPWQWKNAVMQQFTKYIADKDIIFLGKSTDQYLAMQSIRTMSNISHPEKHSIKLPLNILNTAVYRGLPKDQTINAPMLTQWVKNIVQKDEFLAKCNFILLGELASAYCHHPYQSEVPQVPYYFTEQLGAIWRESIHTKLKSTEQAITMAALTYVDANNKSIICEMIKESSLDIDKWLEMFFENTVPALLHFLYKYGMVFSPHGENSILIIEDNLPVGLAMKDFVDDINICKNPVAELRSLPQQVKNAIPQVEDDYLLQFIHTGLFVVHYRYISSILADKLNYPELYFYQKLDECIQKYQTSNLELKSRFERFDLYKPTFTKLCLNRLRIFEVGYSDYSARPKVISTGQLDNPLYLAQSTKNVDKYLFKHNRVSFRAFDLEHDLDTIHSWMNKPHVAKFWSLNKSKSELKKHFCNMLSKPNQKLLILSIDNSEIAYAEIYNTQTDRIANYFSTDDNEYGWHLLIGPEEAIGKGYSKLLVEALSKYCFDILGANNVIFEPDVRVIPFQKIAPKIGYSNLGEIALPEKQAYLFSCSKSSFIEGETL